MTERPEGLPLLTAGLPGCGGLIKAVPEDFEVEELPAYQPSGEGEHLFLWVEKRGRDTQDVVRALCQALEISDRDVGAAGMKDRQGVTRQYLSVPARSEPKLEGFKLEGAQILRAARHQNKLRTGHLVGNRFRIRIREAQDKGAAHQAVRVLREQGVANYFGDQRFGRGDDNAQKGKLLLLGQRLDRAPSRFHRKLYLSAFQSLLFNRALAQRIAEGTLGRALVGDVMKKADTGGLFVCEDPQADQPRVDRFEISPAGPLFGPKMTAAAQQVAAAEARLLDEEGITLADFSRGKGETEGSRRPYRIPFGDAVLEEEGPDLLLRFTLPRGSYATVVLRELMKG